MATCPSCEALVEDDAVSCWHCGAELGVAQAQAAGAELSGSGVAPTVAAGPSDTVETRERSPSAMIGREIIGQYVIVDKLGEGGMGEVYLADQPGIGRQVAIKIVHPQVRERDRDEHMQRFRNEAKAAASLESPHIVSIFNWGELDDGTLFMAMEYLRGKTLRELLEEQAPLDPELAVTIATQICTALAEAHDAGIVHRDLKPSNIMLIDRGDRQNFVKVLDFGVAKLEGSDITRSGAMFGTPQYMSPEQLRSDPIDGRSDLYALGVMLYEMLAGELPFSSPTAVGFVTAHLHEQPPALPRWVPKGLAEEVMDLLAKQADARPASAEQVSEELHAALGGRARSARRRARRRSLRSAVFVLGGLVLASGLGWGGWRLWSWQDQTKAELARKQAELERKQAEIDRQSEAFRKAAADARAEKERSVVSSEQVREQRREIQRSAREGKKRARPKPLDAATKRKLTRSRQELEAELAKVLRSHRVPPSEATDVWADHAKSVEAVEAGELAPEDLRGQLVSMISMYRQGFDRKQRGDNLKLSELEAIFRAMDSELGADEREEIIVATYEAHDADATLSEQDRTYFKRLGLAAQIREHARHDDVFTRARDKGEAGEGEGEGEDEGAGEAVTEPGDEPKPKPMPKPKPKPKPEPPPVEGEDPGLGELPAPD